MKEENKLLVKINSENIQKAMDRLKTGKRCEDGELAKTTYSPNL